MQLEAIWAEHAAEKGSGPAQTGLVQGLLSFVAECQSRLGTRTHKAVVEGLQHPLLGEWLSKMVARRPRPYPFQAYLESSLGVGTGLGGWGPFVLGTGPSSGTVSPPKPVNPFPQGPHCTGHPARFSLYPYLCLMVRTMHECNAK